MDNTNLSPSSGHELTKAEMKKIPFTSYDIGWVILCIGMAIGSGTVIMPIQIGLKGLWVFVLAFLIAYPATYILQKLYLQTLTRSEECEDYANVITQYLGKNWGMFLGILYFLMIIHGVLNYSLSVIFDSASYLQTFGVTETLLSDSMIYRIVVFAVLVAIASKGEKLLFKVSGPMVIIKVGIIAGIGFFMLPHWSLSNIMAIPSINEFARDVLLTMPFAFFSAVFVQILNPMNIAYRKVEKDRRVAVYRSIRAHRVAYIILICVILFFSFSFTLSISHEQAVSAYEQNISALAIAAQVIPGNVIAVMTVVLNIFAILTAFFGIYLGFQESIKGIAVNLISRFIPEERINHKVLSICISVFIVLLLTAWVSTRFKVVIFYQLGSPLYGLVTCLIPCYLVHKVSQLHDLKDWKFWVTFAFGMLLVIAPLLKFFE